ncbi:DUF5631 domain-containing protein [Mycobacterium simulans]|nr:DUF5631 domain-containing protein [Mycobacterium simulans]
MAIFGRMTARRRLRRATQESLTIPTFSSPVDCTPWVIGGLWPAELSSSDAETSTLAAHLNDDLQRIARSANDELTMIRRAGLVESARRAEVANVIDQARALAVRRVESAMRQRRRITQQVSRGYGADLDTTRVMPAVKEPAIKEPLDVDPESDDERLHRLLAFVARQEPRLNWAVGDHVDGTTILVTDLAHGWIPPGITLPEGVRLLDPERRGGSASALLGATTRCATYTPGDSTSWTPHLIATKASMQPREVPAVKDLGRELGNATTTRDGLPRMVHTLAKAAAAGTAVVDEELELLRVHLDTARYQVLAQYPDVAPVLLLNCMLLAATEGSVTADPVAANYHFAWFQKLSR